MPELPEVETVRRVLKTKILNKKIVKINIIYGKMIENDLNFFKETLVNQEFIDIKRKGKYLLFETSNYYLISHLRMEGKFFVKESKEELTKHDHLQIIFEDNKTLIYNDTRKFGRCKLIEKSQLDDYFKKLGPEPHQTTSNYLKNKLKNKNKNIKTLLLDQSIMSGLGNIYANEVLYKANINPYSAGKDLSLESIEKIIKVSTEILDKSIKEGGCTIRSYTSSLGVSGNYQNFLCVHMKENELCQTCKSLIKKDKIDGRSTYYCEKCQTKTN